MKAKTVLLSRELCEAIHVYNEVSHVVADLRAELERSPEWQAYDSAHKELLRAQSDVEDISQDLLDKHDDTSIALMEQNTSKRLLRATDDRRKLRRQLTPLIERDLGIMVIVK